MEVHVRMILMFCKLNCICFHTSDYILEGEGNAVNQGAQFSRFLLGKLIK